MLVKDIFPNGIGVIDRMEEKWVKQRYCLEAKSRVRWEGGEAERGLEGF